MPIKYNETGMDLVNATPLLDRVIDVNPSASEDMMSEILSQKMKMKATSMLNMVGVLTPVTYYQAVADSSNNYNVDASMPSDISYDTKKFIEIKNFKLKLSGATSLNQAGEEEEQSWESQGSAIILPRTIQPNIGDMFIMEYYGRKICYQLTSVNLTSYEMDSGYECEYNIYKTDYTIPKNQIPSTKIYRHDLIATTYRPILDDAEYGLLTKFRKLYDHLGAIFNSLFYDKTIDSYILRNYDIDKDLKEFKDNTNINTLGKYGGVYRSTIQMDYQNHAVRPRGVGFENAAYDNNLNTFISKNRVFRYYDGLLLSVEPKLGLDRVSYKRSIFGCLEAQSISNYKNTFVSPSRIEILTQNINSYFVGKMNVIHDDHPSPDKGEFELVPESLIIQLKNGKSEDMNVKCTGLVYASLDALIIETIVRYVYKRTDDFIDRFLYLYDNMDNLYEHDISYANIYYLFPMLGFILERTLEEMYNNNIRLDK